MNRFSQKRETSDERMARMVRETLEAYHRKVAKAKPEANVKARQSPKPKPVPPTPIPMPPPRPKLKKAKAKKGPMQRRKFGDNLRMVDLATHPHLASVNKIAASLDIATAEASRILLISSRYDEVVSGFAEIVAYKGDKRITKTARVFHYEKARAIIKEYIRRKRQ